ncbi:gamma-glutamylcyclotransferase [Telmatospirillum sp.]|uniref:gamma-glutamylcyclotransferase n=1 Tax=Telmatospirillum sp. TaxID=2079197 RepID=UPI0028477D23|nr:gamma-glutamylcyclotransferase [Telmatospirillum sp.]MDR3439175.1 gamma-glutamylcyclotransferase [Telmatospirillum sp.]
MTIVDSGYGRDDEFWVFAYGSLIWNPGFDYLESAIAVLRGWHRAMCILSTHYRGCIECPGLVLGLDHGGSCRGLAYRIAPSQAADVQRYLDDREMITGVYHPRFIPVALADGRRVPAYVYVARREHPQYAGPLTSDQAARLICQGKGCTGSSRDYLANTVAQLDALGLPDKSLRHLLRLVDRA